MQVTSNLPDHGAIIEAVLEGYVQAAQVIIDAGLVPPSPSDAGVRYRPEPRGSENWLLPHQVMEAGSGDCEDLCIWTAAGLRSTGQDPAARCTLRMTGPSTVHCLVETGDGNLFDPSMQAVRERRAAMRFSASGFSVGDVLQIRDHRGDSGPPPRPTAPAAAANAAPKKVDPALAAAAAYMAAQSKAAGTKYANLTVVTPGGRQAVEQNGLGRGLGDVITQAQAEKAGLDVNAIMDMRPDTSWIADMGNERATYVGDQSTWKPAGGRVSRADQAPNVRPTTPYYKRDESGNYVMYDPKSGKTYDPATGMFYDEAQLDPYTGQPVQYQMDPTTGQFQQYDPYDPYGTGGMYNPYGSIYGYGSYGSPYDEFATGYGYPTPYGYDPIYRGYWPETSQYGFGGYDDVPMTYADLYSEDGSDEFDIDLIVGAEDAE